jgi:hypothetical protein
MRKLLTSGKSGKNQKDFLLGADILKIEFVYCLNYGHGLCVCYSIYKTLFTLDESAESLSSVFIGCFLSTVTVRCGTCKQFWAVYNAAYYTILFYYSCQQFIYF